MGRRPDWARVGQTDETNTPASLPSPRRRIMPIAPASPAASGLTRRRFAQLLTGLSVLAVIEPQLMVRALAADRHRLSWLASRNPSAEGAWRLTDIEGAVPKELVGTLYRIAPGQKETHGVRLRHLFDG